MYCEAEAFILMSQRRCDADSLWHHRAPVPVCRRCRVTSKARTTLSDIRAASLQAWWVWDRWNRKGAWWILHVRKAHVKGGYIALHHSRAEHGKADAS